MTWFLLYMIQRPDIQKKAQAELDNIIGRDRLPSFEDFNQLTYIQAIVKETLRRNPVAPLGMQHCSIQDDWYDGHFIPKGTICLPNIWYVPLQMHEYLKMTEVVRAMNRDTDIWGSDATEFRPERFLDENGQLKAAVPDTHEEGHVTFGFGRRFDPSSLYCSPSTTLNTCCRICVGRHLANKSLFLNIACLLWTFDIKPDTDKDGNPIIPDESSFNEGLVV